MAKRFSATEIWEEDWFLDMPNEYKLYWFYMLSTCDHGGIFRVNVNSFNRLLKYKVTAEKAMKLFNTDKKRIRELNNKTWFIEDFFTFQYGGKLNIKNQTHKSVLNLYNKHGINIMTVRGVEEVKNGSESGNEHQ